MGNLFSSTNNLPNQYVHYRNNYEANQLEDRVLNAGSSIDSEENIINELAAYQDAANLVLAATMNPQPEAINPAWESVYPKVVFMGRVYDYCEKLANQIVCLFSFLLSNEDEQGNEALRSHPVIATTLINYLSKAIYIDSIKITLPNMLMDLAFFRRVATRMSNSSETQALYQKSSKISMFLGQGTPTITKLIELSKTTFEIDDQTLKRFLVLLGALINTCAANVRDQVEDDGNCLKAMTAAFLIYDEMNKDGAFQSRADFAVLQALTVLVHYQPQPTTLVNTIKYSTKHINDKNTIPQVKTLLNIQS